MARMTGKTHWERFLAAIAAGEDERAEKIALLLGATDEPALLELTRSDDANRRWWALRGLAHCGSERAGPVVVTSLTDTNADVRAVAALALGHLARQFPEQAAPWLCQLAARLGDDDGLVRQAAAEGLALNSDDAVAVLAAALDHAEAGIRARAAYALYRIGTMAAAQSLYSHLDDASPLVRHYAYETLEALGLLENMLLAP